MLENGLFPKYIHSSILYYFCKMSLNIICKLSYTNGLLLTMIVQSPRQPNSNRQEEGMI